MEFTLGESIARRGGASPEVVAAIMRVARDRFVPRELRDAAHVDAALPIGHAQSISQPSIVALMTEALQVRPGARMLEIGTGSGYQAAVLCELGVELYSVERLEGLAKRAALTLATLGYRVHLKVGDGRVGWKDAAPFDGVIVTAAASQVPAALVLQLRVGGRLVIPLGDRVDQRLTVFERRPEGAEIVGELGLVRFVPLL